MLPSTSQRMPSAADGVREPNAAVGMNRNVVRRIQPFSFELIRNNGDRSIRLVAHHAPSAVFARKLPALVVEGVAVAVAGRIPKYRDASIILDPSHLHVVRDITPNQISADTIPCRPFGPQRPKVQTPNDRVADDKSAEPVIQSDNIRIRILNRILSRVVPRRGC